jgi:polyribonucleotide nucleotidyltransferase
MFQRGDTQNIAITTLGPTKEAQDMDGLTGGATSKSFILHYNFPPFSVGETGRFTGPGRREIGHGALAERSPRSGTPPGRRLPLFHPRRVRNHGVEWIDVHGIRLRRLSRPHGRRRTDHRTGGGQFPAV